VTNQLVARDKSSDSH